MTGVLAKTTGETLASVDVGNVEPIHDRDLPYGHGLNEVVKSR